MKKLFVSCPMRDRTEENIRKSIEKMHRIAEAVFDEELEQFHVQRLFNRRNGC